MENVKLWLTDNPATIYSVSALKKPVGVLILNGNEGCGFSVTIYKRPNWFHRLMMRLLLGWTFVPNEDAK